MSVRSRIEALEAAARRRRYPVAMVPPLVVFDESDPEYVDLNRRVTDLLGDRTGLHPADVAGIVMREAPDLSREIAELGERAMGRSPVSHTGESERE